MLDLRPLTLYPSFKEEIEEALYRNTTFAFNNGKEFGKFIAHRTPSQLSQIRGLMIGCDWSAWLDSVDWEEAIRIDTLKKLSKLTHVHFYLGGLFPYKLTTIWERFEVCPLKSVTFEVRKHGSQVYGAINQGPIDECERMKGIILQEWNETSGEARLKELEQKIAEDLQDVVVLHPRGWHGERPGEDWFG